MANVNPQCDGGEKERDEEKENDIQGGICDFTNQFCKPNNVDLRALRLELGADSFQSFCCSCIVEGLAREGFHLHEF